MSIQLSYGSFEELQSPRRGEEDWGRTDHVAALAAQQEGRRSGT